MKLGWRVLDAVASASVVGSFGRSGYAIRRRSFADPELDVDLSSRTVVVTGASSGLGKSAAQSLAARGATVVLVARDPGRLAHALDEVRARAKFPTRVDAERADLSLLSEVRGLAARLAARLPKLDVLIHNAGVLPLERTTTPEGLDAAFTTNVLSGFLLTHELSGALAAGRGGRVVHVTSGGMYLKKLALDELEGARQPYDGVAVYAQSKRAQVILSELWANKLAPRAITSNAVHPGWAETPGVERSLPRFFRVMRPLLRSAEEGADTIVWLAASGEVEGVTGRLFFDRAERATDVLPWTRSEGVERAALWARCCELTGVRP